MLSIFLDWIYHVSLRACDDKDNFLFNAIVLKMKLINLSFSLHSQSQSQKPQGQCENVRGPRAFQTVSGLPECEVPDTWMETV